MLPKHVYVIIFSILTLLLTNCSKTSPVKQLTANEVVKLNKQHREQVEKLVNRGITYLNQYGLKKAVKAFNDPFGHFHQKSYYIYIFQCQTGEQKSLEFSNIARPDLVGKNVFNNPVAHYMILHASTKPAWFSYQWKDSETGRIEQKYSYMLKVEKYGVCLGSGFYNHKA